MKKRITLNLPGEGVALPMPGLEADSLLSLLALVGLLRSIEQAEPEWRVRAAWMGPPWQACLHVPEGIAQQRVADVATTGLETIASHFDVDGRSNVSFESAEEFRTYARRVRNSETNAALAAAMTSEVPTKRQSGGLQAAPLVMLLGQGHQNFLDRLVAVPRGELPRRLRKKKSPPDLRDPAWVREALFSPWQRQDDADAFRWDPSEDQRYALRFDDPSRAGAALTVHGANRLAAIGFLSFTCAPRQSRATVPGVTRAGSDVSFVWPIWRPPLTLAGVQALLGHPDVVSARLERVRHLGVVEIMQARRIPNGKFMNVTRARSTIRSSEP